MGLNFEDVLRANDEMSEAIQRVRDLHKPFMADELLCQACRDMNFPHNIYYAPYPCPTIKALDGEQ